VSFGPYQDSTPRLPLGGLIVLAALYLLAGLDHDPWKTEDAIHIGIAYGFATQGAWLTPMVAGEAWPHTAPLYHWTAAILGELLGGVLEFHNAARLATPLFGALFLVFLSAAARRLHGESAGRLAPLLALGTLGLLLQMHEAQPAVAGLACAALAWWGGARVLRGEAIGALWLGLGIGLSFPAHGLVGLIMAGAALPAPLLRRDGRSVLIALAVALPLIALWPVLLAQTAPEYWTQWWRNEIAEASQARGLPTLQHLKQLVWAVWPLWPLAAWSLWRQRHASEQLWLPGLGLLITLAWFLSGAPRSAVVLPVLIPLTLLAVGDAERLRRGAASAFDWFGGITFSCIAVLIWLGATAQGFGWPAPLARNFAKLAPGHTADFGIAALAIAATATALWGLAWRLRRVPWRPALRWAAGVTLMWLLTATLWLPWIDYASSYRPVALSLHQALPAVTQGCIERDDFGIAQRASLDYFTGIRTVAAGHKPQCAWRLTIAPNGRTPPPGWQEVWQGGRASDRKERWYLDRRAD